MLECDNQIKKNQKEYSKGLQQISSELQESKPLTKREVLELVEEIAQQPKKVEEEALKLTTELEKKVKRIEDQVHRIEHLSDPSEDPSSDHIPPLPAISPFLSSADDTTDSDTPDTPPSPTHDSSLEASSDFHSDSSSDSSSRHSLPDHSSLDLPSTSAGLSCKRRRSPMTFVPALSPASRALSPVRVDLIPSPKRVRDSDYLADVEVDSRESSEPSRSRGTLGLRKRLGHPMYFIFSIARSWNSNHMTYGIGPGLYPL
ncbi:putative reverse transcriptase domain-containing protein [Tanacetum coccineum]